MYSTQVKWVVDKQGQKFFKKVPTTDPATYGWLLVEVIYERGFLIWFKFSFVMIAYISAWKLEILEMSRILTVWKADKVECFS